MRKKKTNIETAVQDFTAKKLVPPATFQCETDENKNIVEQGDLLLSSGSTMFNLCCSDSVKGAFIPGRFYLMIGSSASGKTWLMMNTIAEACHNKQFANYDIVYDDIESGNNIDVAKYFGNKTASAIKPPKVDKNGEAVYSVTVEDFYDNLDNNLTLAENNHRGLIYICDSMDSLSSMAEIEKALEQKEAREKDKDVKGSMTDGKAKVNAQNLRRVCSRLKKSGSMLFMVCQERDNLSCSIPCKTFSGGNSLLFYATVQIWLKRKGEILATIAGKQRCLGSETEITIKKNRLTGQLHKNLTIPFLHSSGIDDIGSVIDFLIEERHWNGGLRATDLIEAKEFDISLPKEKLVRWIEDNNKEDELKQVVQNVWNKIKSAIAEKMYRKPKYED